MAIKIKLNNTMNKVLFFSLLFCFTTNEVIGQNAKSYPFGEKNYLEITPAQGQVNEKGKPLKPKIFKKETGVVNGMKIVNYAGINWIYEQISRNDYSGIQGFPGISSRQHEGFKLNGTVNLPDVVVIDHYYQSFFSGTDIEKVVFSPNIKKICGHAFNNCKKLTEIVFPEGCGDVEIDEYAFPIEHSNWEGLTTNINKIFVPKGRIEEFANKINLPEAFFDDGTCTLELDIKVEKPSTILDKLPVDKLKQIRSLTITGILDENDIEVLKGCIYLKKLDLSNAYTTLSEELQKKRKANSVFLRGMIQAMGELSQKKYENGEISTVDNLQVQLFTDLVKGTSNVKEASVGCVIPTGSFSGMRNLETVILPVRASEIESKAFQDCPNLKEVILPPYLKEIDTGAFAFCGNLKSIAFPKTLTTIGMYDRQHTYGKSAAASFVETGIEKMDFSNCIFENNTSDNWSYRFHCKNLKVIKLPNTDDIDVGFGSESQVICYVSSCVKRLRILDRVREIHFSSPNPPYVKDGLSNCIIYVPKGCLTQYYAKFNGNGNTFNEE